MKHPKYFQCMWIRQCGMCDQQGLRSACTYAQSGLGLCLSLECSVTVGLLAGHRLGFLCRGWGAVRVCLGLHMSEGHIVGGRVPRLIYYPILLYTCALEIFAVKTTSLSKVLLLFFAFFAFRAPTCQPDVFTLQIKLCLTVFFPWFFKGRIYVTIWVLIAFRAACFYRLLWIYSSKLVSLSPI